MRIGISVLTYEAQNIWANGLGQNVFHLARLMRSIPFVDEVIMINCGDRPAFTNDAAPGVTDFPLIPPRDATDRIDVVIEMAGGLDVEWLDLMRARGKKVVFHVCGHPYAGLIEPTVFGVPGFFSRPDRCDAVWILPQFRAFAAMLSATHRCPVFESPYIWGPSFLERRIGEVAVSGARFGYSREPGAPAAPLRAAIFEPNISVTKTCAIPMLICDEATRRNPDAIGTMRVLCADQLKDHPTFACLAASLDLSAAGAIEIEGRHDIVSHMAKYADLVVSHQWRHAQNYLYLDVLWGDYPLVHNSPWLGDAGYFYPDSDTGVGADQVIAAWVGHSANLDGYRARARRLFDDLDPMNPDNVTAYARRLLDLRPASASGATA